MSKKLKVIALVCERSVNFEGHLDDSQCLKTCDDVRVIQVPCSGIIQPSIRTLLSSNPKLTSCLKRYVNMKTFTLPCGF